MNPSPRSTTRPVCISKGVLLEAAETYRKTVVLVTHDIDEAVALSRNVIVLSGQSDDRQGDPCDRPRRAQSDRRTQRSALLRNTFTRFARNSTSRPRRRLRERDAGPERRTARRSRYDRFDREGTRQRSRPPLSTVDRPARRVPEVVLASRAADGCRSSSSSRSGRRAFVIGWISAFLFGSPSGIARFAAKSIADGSLFYDTWVTVFEATLGFVIGTAVGSARRAAAVVLAVPRSDR